MGDERCHDGKKDRHQPIVFSQNFGQQEDEEESLNQIIDDLEEKVNELLDGKED